MVFKVDGCSFRAAHPKVLYEEIGNIIAEILSAKENTESYEEVANHSQL